MESGLVFRTEQEAVSKIHELPSRETVAEIPLSPSPTALTPDVEANAGSADTSSLTAAMSPLLRRTLEIKVVSDSDSFDSNPVDEFASSGDIVSDNATDSKTAELDADSNQLPSQEIYFPS